MAQVQTGQTLGQKTTLPARDGIGVAVQFLTHHPMALPIGYQKGLVGLAPHHGFALAPIDSTRVVQIVSM
jgi:hypothetical protein